ncbi:LacI family DNA-binding transcriptional regulator [uncultured Roseobacter sp.]|uniref:LacI family DNA-binding transcriptional regulator n=1 Tax=uncultured Roseobacter sp. TaxID=114847 RepID=UPI002608EE39|nr:LacI family DNA-binding transcriptional regulator [uncultured Roseobacter sp.]
MAGKPTLGSVAKEAGVSIPTVSQVMRGTGRISEQTRRKVLQAAKKLHYVPDSRAAAMRSGENREIGFVINQISNPFNAEVIFGVSDLLEADGYLVSVLDARDDTERQGRHLEAFIRNGRGGLLWLPALDTPAETFSLLRAHSIPVVTFLRRTEMGGFDHVGIRNAEATACATQHLVDRGHRHIAYLGGDIMTSVRRERIDGYTTALATANLGPPIIWDCQDNKLAGLMAMQALRLAHPDVTGVVCNGDTVALGACLALQRDGLVPGEALSIVGFDDIQDAAVATPPLTTMAVSPYELGRRLARVLLERIREPNAPVTTSEISAELVVRSTTGSVASD